MIQRRIKDEFGVSEHTIVNWMSFIREVCEKDIIDNPMILGGIQIETNVPKEVEIDESLFFRREYNRGRAKNGVWVFGAVERGSSRCSLAVVE